MPDALPTFWSSLASGFRRLGLQRMCRILHFNPRQMELKYPHSFSEIQAKSIVCNDLLG